MKIGELLFVIETFAPPALQEDYDNAGLITGKKDWNCTGAICTLDVTVAVIDEALQFNCNLIVAHHPIVFRGLKRVNGSNYVEEVIIKAIKNDIAIYAAHTNLDNVLLGVNHIIAQKLSLQNTRILQPKPRQLKKLITFAPIRDADKVREALFAHGAGNIGNYSEASFNSQGIGTYKAEKGANPYLGKVGQQHQEPEVKIEVVFPVYAEQSIVAALLQAHPYEEVAYDIFAMDNTNALTGSGLVGELETEMTENNFLTKLKEAFGLKVIKHTALLNQPIKKVAVCGGAGSFLIKKAAQSGAQVYISADIKYHEFFDAEQKIVVADIGHYESEQFTVNLLHDLLVEKFPTFAVLKTSVNTNPVEYFM